MSNVIRLSLDTEFNEEAPMGHWSATDFISIGLVNIDQTISAEPLSNIGFYAVSSEFNQQAAANFDFVRDHVLPKLFIDCFEGDRAMPEQDIAEGVKDYLRQQVRQKPGADTIELWALNKTTDMYLFSKMFGSQVRMRQFLSEIGIEKFIERDLKELKPLEQGIIVPKPKLIKSKYHNAFYDSCHQALTIQWIEGNQLAVCTETASMDYAIRSGFFHS